jgi:hypothetical protein
VLNVPRSSLCVHVLWMKSSHEWQVGAMSRRPLQRGTTWCPRVGTSRLQNAQTSSILSVQYPSRRIFIRVVGSKFRTPGWSLPPTHPRAFELKHDSTTSEFRSIGACKQCPVRCRQRGARASSRSGVQKLVRAPGNAPGPGTHLVRLRL